MLLLVQALNRDALAPKCCLQEDTHPMFEQLGRFGARTATKTRIYVNLSCLEFKFLAGSCSGELFAKIVISTTTSFFVLYNVAQQRMNLFDCSVVVDSQSRFCPDSTCVVLNNLEICFAKSVN